MRSVSNVDVLVVSLVTLIPFVLFVYLFGWLPLPNEAVVGGACNIREAMAVGNTSDAEMYYALGYCVGREAYPEFPYITPEWVIIKVKK